MADNKISTARVLEGALLASPPPPHGVPASAGTGLAGLLRTPQAKTCDTVAESTRRLLIWEKGIPIRGYDPAEWRLDKHGFTIQFSQHGRRDSAFGWEIDHIVPESWGGSDEIQNLQPVYWRVNAHKSDRFTG